MIHLNDWGHINKYSFSQSTYLDMRFDSRGAKVNSHAYLRNGHDDRWLGDSGIVQQDLEPKTVGRRCELMVEFVIEKLGPAFSACPDDHCSLHLC
jgi:hypothetical protein